MSFDKHSNFNKQANFTEVKFGENKPVLEVELNELQQIQNEARADIVRDSIPSGFTQLGEIDYDYCLNNENKIKLKTDSVAYVNGYRINIPKDTIIDIGKAPEKASREDLLFLEVWKEEVNSTSTLYKEGGEGQASIPNNIKDSRYPIETTHRVALKWRIRHVADVDFNRYHMDGFSAGTSGRNRQVTAQGGSDKPFIPTFDTDATGSFNRSDLLHLNDKGLFVTSQNAELFKTFDGYVYAIPMFRLYRKPSCGKSIPFEYSKINPKVDYNKFTKLIKEDKVERVLTENVKGRSLVNLDSGYYNCYFATNSNVKIEEIPNGKKFTKINDTSEWQYLFIGNFVSRLKPSTTYTMTYKYNTNRANFNLPFSLPIQTGEATNNITNVTFNEYSEDILIGTFTTPSTFENKSQRLYMSISGWSNNDWCEISEVQVLEGVFNHKSIPDFFIGLKSLGEEDNNVITLKNEILNDDTYDVNDGNQKLLAFSEVTHVNSTNTIIPTIEANVIKGEESTPLEKLGSKLETEGNEVIEFTKIKGKTIQNLWDNASTVVTISALYQRLCLSTIELVANKTYTLVVNVQGGAVDFKKFEGNEVIQTLQPGVHVVSYTPNINSKVLLIALGEVGAKYNMKALLLDGDFTNTPLEDIPFVEGIKSVGETEGNIVTLHSTGKNIYNGISENTFTTTVDSWYFLDGKAGAYGDMSSKTDTIFTLPKGQYKFNYEGSYIQLCTVDESQSWGRDTLIDLKTDTKLVFRLKNGVGTVSFNNLYIEAGDILTGYKPYQRYNQNIYLREPLRSLPNGVCDEIVGNKVIRRVGKVILDGSTTMGVDTALNQSNTIAFIITNPGLRNKDNGSLLSSVLPPVYGDTYWSEDMECIMSANDLYFKIRVLKTKLDSLDNGGMQKWLKSNPITVYYELLNPIDEYLENVYEKESIKTYQLDAPLRSLPNGVKDEIKDGVLVRRVGEKVINGTENWGDENSPTITLSNITRFILNDNTLNVKLNCHLMPNNRYLTSVFYANEKEGIYSDTTVNNRLWIHVLKTNLEAQDTTSLKKWLQSNPVKFIYELATPVETRLKEVKPQKADFSLDRQFGEGNWLRELPNGVKDTIENGKVIRRTKKLVLNGSENWTTSRFTEQSEFIGFELAGIGLKPGNRTNLVCDKFNVIETINQNNTCEGIQASSTDDLLWIKIYKTRLTEQTIQGFKTWLQSNLITLIFELATPTEETLSTDNYMSYPCHDFNTYCGSMYVGEGRNYVISDNKMPTEDIILVETDFREIEGKAKVEDCKYKKNEEGYDNLYVGSRSKNLVLLDNIKHLALTENNGNLWSDKEHELSYDENGVITWLNKDTYEWSDLGCIIRVKPNTKYTFSLDLVSKTSSGACNLVVAQYSSAPILDKGEANVSTYLGITKAVSSDTLGVRYYTFTTPNNCHYVYCMLSVKAFNTTYTIKDFMINEGDLISFEPGIKSSLAYENIEENDIEDLRHSVSLTGFNYNEILNKSFDKLLRGEL